jgi:hypothetical protein
MLAIRASFFQHLLSRGKDELIVRSNRLKEMYSSVMFLVPEVPERLHCYNHSLEGNLLMLCHLTANALQQILLNCLIKTLILREIPEGDVRSLLSDRESLAPCDVAVFVYDSCDEYSWQRARDLLVQVATHGENTGYEVPCLIVAAKDDLDQCAQALQESTRVSQDMGIETPIPISVKLRDLNNIFCRIVHAAQQPHLSIPETEAGKTRRQYRQLLNRSLMVVSVGAAVAVVGIAAYRVYAARKNSSS